MRIDVRQANDAWESLLTAHARLMRHFGERDDWRGLSMREYDVLYTLAKASGPLRLGDAREGVLLSQPALSRLVDRLESRGFVSRTVDPADARAVRIALTEEGAKRQRQVGRAHGATVARTVAAALSADEQRTLAALCAKLADHAADPVDETERDVKEETHVDAV